MTIETTNHDNMYEVKIRVLGNEIFAIAIEAPDTSNRVLLAGLVTVFCVLTILGAYGSDLVALFKSLTG
jgi:hypothetical protein